MIQVEQKPAVPLWVSVRRSDFSLDTAPPSFALSIDNNGFYSVDYDAESGISFCAYPLNAQMPGQLTVYLQEQQGGEGGNPPPTTPASTSPSQPRPLTTYPCLSKPASSTTATHYLTQVEGQLQLVSVDITGESVVLSPIPTLYSNALLVSSASVAFNSLTNTINILIATPSELIHLVCTPPSGQSVAITPAPTQISLYTPTQCPHIITSLGISPKLGPTAITVSTQPSTRKVYVHVPGGHSTINTSAGLLNTPTAATILPGSVDTWIIAGLSTSSPTIDPLTSPEDASCSPWLVSVSIATSPSVSILTPPVGVHTISSIAATPDSGVYYGVFSGTEPGLWNFNAGTWFFLGGFATIDITPTVWVPPGMSNVWASPPTSQAPVTTGVSTLTQTTITVDSTPVLQPQILHLSLAKLPEVLPWLDPNQAPGPMAITPVWDDISTPDVSISLSNPVTVEVSSYYPQTLTPGPWKPSAPPGLTILPSDPSGQVTIDFNPHPSPEVYPTTFITSSNKQVFQSSAPSTKSVFPVITLLPPPPTVGMVSVDVFPPSYPQSYITPPDILSTTKIKAAKAIRTHDGFIYLSLIAESTTYCTLGTSTTQLQPVLSDHVISDTGQTSILVTLHNRTSSTQISIPTTDIGKDPGTTENPFVELTFVSPNFVPVSPIM